MDFCWSHFLANHAVFSPGSYAEAFEESQLLVSSCALVFLPLDSSHLHEDQVLHLKHIRYILFKSIQNLKNEWDTHTVNKESLRNVPHAKDIMCLLLLHNVFYSSFSRFFGKLK